MDEPLKVPNQSICLNRLRVKRLPAGKGEKLRDQTCPPVCGLPRHCSKFPDAVLVRCAVLDQFKVSGNHHQQIVEVMGDAPRELTDRLHLLALMKLLLDQVALLDGTLMRGDVAKQDRNAFAGCECMDVVPDISVECLEGSQTLLRHRLVESDPDFWCDRVRKGFAEVCPDEVASSRQPRLCLLVEVGDIPAGIDDEDAVGHALKYRCNSTRRLLGFLPGVLGVFLGI